MKLKKYWKIILSVTVVLLLITIAISNIDVSKPENNTIEGNIDTETSDTLDENNEDIAEEENKDESLKSNEEAVLKDENKASDVTEKTEVIESKTTATVSQDTKNEVNNQEQVCSVVENEGSKKTQPENSSAYCTFSIDCSTVLNNKSNLKPGKEGCLGSNGLIFSGNVEVVEGQSVKEVLSEVCKKNNIKVSYKGDYVKAINNLSEKDCGKLSGWMYSINGKIEMKSISACKVNKNDVIKFIYTCDSGKDIS